MNETLTWNGFTYTVKPFNLGNLFALWEAIAAQEDGRIFTGMFENTCKSILQGTTNEAQAFLISGGLTKSVLASENVQEAYTFKERVDSFSTSFNERAEKLKKSAPDLTDMLARKQPKPTRKSQKDTKAAPAHSG